jgi:hypothetical protein
MFPNTPYNPNARRSRSKYGAKPTILDGIKFASKWESERYGILKVMQSAGVVRDLKLQVPYRLEINGQLICKYIPDFTYEKQQENGDWEFIVEDAKGVETPEFKLKKKMMLAIHNINILLTRKK